MLVRRPRASAVRELLIQATKPPPAAEWRLELVNLLESFGTEPNLQRLVAEFLPRARRSVSRSVLVICHWAVAKQYQTSALPKPILTATLLRHLASTPDSQHVVFESLMLFLEQYDDSYVEAALFNLFAELIRTDVLTHDRYVRFLISSGRLEVTGTDSQTAGSTIHGVCLLNFPILSWETDRSQFRHETNQRYFSLRVTQP